MHERQALAENEGVDFNKLDIKVTRPNTLVLSAVKAGLGLTIQSKSLVQDDVRRGDLQKICQLHQPEYGYYGLLPAIRRAGSKWPLCGQTRLSLHPLLCQLSEVMPCTYSGTSTTSLAKAKA